MRQGTYISFADAQDGGDTQLVTRQTPLPVKIGGAGTTQFGEVKTASRTQLIELSSAYGQSLIRDVVAETGTGTVVNAPGEIVISTGATAASFAGIKSADAGRYLPGYGAEIGIGIRVPAPPTGEQELVWGGRNTPGTDGFIWGYDASGMYVSRLAEGVLEGKTYQLDWNVDKLDGTGRSGVILDLTAGNIFHIDFTWYGYGQIIWNVVTVANGQQQPIPVHREKVNGATSIRDPNMQLIAEASNGATASDIVAYLGGRQYSIVGGYVPAYRFCGQYRAPVTTGTTSVPTVTFRAKTGFLNRAINVDMIDISAAGEDVIVEMVLNGTLTGASYATPTNHTPNEVCCEVDTSATAISGGVVLWSDYFAAGSGNKGLLSESLVSFPIPEDQPISLCVRTTTGAGTCAVFFRMREEW